MSGLTSFSLAQSNVKIIRYLNPIFYYKPENFEWLWFRFIIVVSQRTLTMFVGVVALHYVVYNGVPQLPQT